MSLAVRGSWELHEAIQQAWNLSGLDDIFRAETDEPTDRSYPTLSEKEARPNTPFPYCVFDVETMPPTGHSTGRTLVTQQQYLRSMVTFTIHANQRNGESGKSICVRLCKAVSAVFDPPARLDLPTDKHIATIRDVDASQRLDDDEWAWAVSYVFLIDASYNAPSCE